MIRAGAGLSTLRDSAGAAREAAERAVLALGGAAADWCVLFATTDHGEALPDVLGTLHEVAGTPYVAGCSGAGVIAEGLEVEDGPALGVLAVAADSVRATPFLFPDEGDHGLSAGIRVGQRLLASRGTEDLVLVWPDPFLVRPDRLLEGIESALGPVPVAGGAAASRGPGEATFQLRGSDRASGAVAGLRLGGTFRHRVAVTQGCRPVSGPLLVTGSHGTLILEIEGRPAFEVLREHAAPGLFEDPERSFAYLFVGLLPEGQEAEPRPGEYLVRNVVTVDEDTGVVGISDEVEEGRQIVFVLREAAAAREDLARVLDGVVADRARIDYRFGLYFDCLARGRSLYRAAGVDVSLLERALPGVPLLGFFCSAEIAPLRGVNQLFTYTGVLVLVGE